MEKLNKLSLPATILIASIVLGGFYYASELNKQKSIEKQQQTELQEKSRIANEQAVQQKEQQDREFDAKQKESCLAIYKQESSKWSNVDGWRYSDTDDACYILYKETVKKTKAQCDAKYKDSDGKVIPFLFRDYLLCQDGVFEKSF